MKKRLFIGTSSEELSLARKAKKVLEKDFEVVIWNDKIWDTAVFRINQNFLTDLLVASLKFDFGILIGTKDDKVEYRGKQVLQPRDNVIFELGLFLGRLGGSKCAFLVENELNILTDLQGITLSMFDRSSNKSFISAVERIRTVFESSSKSEINFFPSATLASVYFENFISPTCKYLIDHQGYTLQGIHYKKYKLKIIIPDRIASDLNVKFESLKARFPTTKVDIESSGRPRNIYHETQINNETIEFIDFPTIISGINFAILNLLPHEFNQLSLDYDLIVRRELDRFVDTLKKLLLRGGFDEIVDFVSEKDLNKP